MTDRQALIRARKLLSDKEKDAFKKYKHYQKKSYIDEDSNSYDLMQRWSGAHDSLIFAVFVLDDILRKQRKNNG